MIHLQIRNKGEDQRDEERGEDEEGVSDDEGRRPEQMGGKRERDKTLTN